MYVDTGWDKKSEYSAYSSIKTFLLLPFLFLDSSTDSYIIEPHPILSDVALVVRNPEKDIGIGNMI